jgi:hypothetical protein
MDCFASLAMTDDVTRGCLHCHSGMRRRRRPESILTIVVMDSGLTDFVVPRNDGSAEAKPIRLSW